MTTDQATIRGGSPQSFGWLRRPDLDKRHIKGQAWEKPDGTIQYLPCLSWIAVKRSSPSPAAVDPRQSEAGPPP
jgi:hypothetical protein